MVATGEGEGEDDVTLEKEADGGIETGADTDDGAQISGREAANSGLGNGGTSTRQKAAAAAEVEREEVAGSNQTKRVGARSCPPVGGSREAATLRRMAGEDR